MRSPITWNTVVQHDVGEQALADVNVALHDAQETRVADSPGLHELGLEQDFSAAETLVTDSDDVAIWKLVGRLRQSAKRRSQCFQPGRPPATQRSGTSRSQQETRATRLSTTS